MLTLVLGLVLFLGAHSMRVFAEGWRADAIERVGERAYKGVYSLVSVAGFVLIVVGYGLARQDPQVLWPQPPVWTRHLAALLTLVAFVLVTAAYVPGNVIRAKLRHPMVLGVKVWAFAHLVANNTLADAVLFGSFLVWAIFDFRAARERDRTLASVETQARGSRIVVTLVVAFALWAVFAFWLHRALIGVSPLGV